jgi:hypothetical protein
LKSAPNSRESWLGSPITEKFFTPLRWRHQRRGVRKYQRFVRSGSAYRDIIALFRELSWRGAPKNVNQIWEFAHQTWEFFNQLWEFPHHAWEFFSALLVSDDPGDAFPNWNILMRVTIQYPQEHHKLLPAPCDGLECGRKVPCVVAGSFSPA